MCETNDGVDGPEVLKGLRIHNRTDHVKGQDLGQRQPDSNMILNFFDHPYHHRRYVQKTTAGGRLIGEATMPCQSALAVSALP